MTLARRTRTTLAAFAFALAGVAVPGSAVAQSVGAAQAPDVGPVKTLTAGKKAPVTIPGTGLKKGMTIKKGTKVVSRAVTVADGETVRFTLSCGKGGSTFMGLGTGGEAIFNLDQRASYVGRRSVRLKADTARATGDSAGVMYGLCVRR